jgi:hypothetical protein
MNTMFEAFSLWQIFNLCDGPLAYINLIKQNSWASCYIARKIHLQKLKSIILRKTVDNL